MVGMLARSGANILLNSTVESVTSQQNGRYRVQHSTTSWTSSRDDNHSSIFDDVVIATPLKHSRISLVPGLPPILEDVEYVHLQVTLLTSPHKIDPSYFDLEPGTETPEVILTTLSDCRANQLPFFSISMLQKVVNPQISPPRQEYAYKIFSDKAPSFNFLYRLFGNQTATQEEDIDGENITWIERKSWLSYPRLKPRTKFIGPRLDNAGLWYTSGIEPFISTMETSSLMGMNIAKLIANQRNPKSERLVDNEEL